MGTPRVSTSVMLAALVLAITATSAVTAALVPDWGPLDVWPPLCALDADCVRYGAVCSASVGDGAVASCQCPWGTAWNSTWVRCETVASGTARVVTYSEPPRYAEYESSLEGRGQPFLPETWYCDGGDLATCWARDAVIEYRTPAVADVLDTSEAVLRASDVQWKCRDEDRRAWIGSADGSSGRQVQRPIPEYCLEAVEWCFASGTRAVRADGGCECHATHAGDRCGEPSAILLQLAPIDTDGLPSGSGMWTTRACTGGVDCGDGEACYWRFPLQDGARRCVCLPGHVPDRTSVSGCVAEQGYRYLGLVDHTDPRITYDATYAASDPRLLHLTGTDSIQVVYTALPLAEGEDDYRVAASDTVYFTCFEGEPRDDIAGVTRADQLCGEPEPGLVCLNGGAWDTGLGACACVEGYTGSRCEMCPLPAAGLGCTAGVEEARLERCNGHGVPDSTDACHCDDARFGERCEMDGQQCRADRCNAHGQCHVADSGCACAPGRFGWYCDHSRAACNLDRCSGHGACEEQVVGCACVPPWSGVACDVPECGSHGAWENATEVCSCDEAYTGVSCELSKCGYHGYWHGDACTCLGRAEADATTGNCTKHSCGDHGRLDPRTATGVCVCDSGYAPDPQAAATDDVCRLVCHHEGSLADFAPLKSPDQCYCRSGYRGPACVWAFTGSSGRAMPVFLRVLSVIVLLLVGVALGWSYLRERHTPLDRYR